MSENNLIDIAGFRVSHNLRQSDLATILGTSRGYISIAESQTKKLSQEKIDIIHSEFPGPNGLVPCYDRLLYLLNELLEDGDIDEKYREDPLRWYEEFLTKPVVEGIKYGKMGINYYIADLIAKQVPDCKINRDWIVTGEGDMFLLTINNSFTLTDSAGLYEKLDILEQKLDHIISIIENKN